MRVVSDKYIAGFLDADGSVELTTDKKHLRLGFYQKKSNDGVIYLINKVLDVGTISELKGKTRGTETFSTRLIVTGQKAIDTLCRLKPYLVTKRVKSNKLLSEIGFTERVGTDSIPVHPSRSWLAGYFDGDGCVYAQLNPRGRSASVKVSIDSNTDEKDGLELVKKAFGGVIETRGHGKQIRWTLGVDAPKAEKFLSYIAPRLLNKREQAYFVLACSKMGHFRDGETITNTLKELKTHPHRLNDLGSEVDISRYVDKVKDLNRNDGKPYNYSFIERCRECGSPDVYALFLCNKCYQRNQYHTRVKRQSKQIFISL